MLIDGVFVMLKENLQFKHYKQYRITFDELDIWNVLSNMQMCY